MAHIDAQNTPHVLSSVPDLPTQINVPDASASETPGATAGASTLIDDAMLDDANQTTVNTAQYTPQVYLRIVPARLPGSIADGIRLLARHAPRKNVILAEEQSLFSTIFASSSAAQPVKAYSAGPSTATSSPNVWWWNVEFVEDTSLAENALEITTSDSQFTGTPNQPFSVQIAFKRPCEAFRGLGHVLGTLRIPPVAARGRSNAAAATSKSTSLGGPAFDRESKAGDLDTVSPLSADEEAAMMSRLCIRETANFTTMGTMIDCSRNGVLRVKTIKFLCRKLAMMGFNMLQLYTEETYKIEGEPFFGYLRGGYSEAALRDIDDYAYSLGIEVIPCIQTLGHLGQMLQWPRFLHLRDTSEVLLAESAETYAMLRKMMTAATRPFRSKKIHLGMDETHGLGHGRYHSIFGQYTHKDPTRIFTDHLSKVNTICRELNLQPCIWSDMLFCLNARNNSLLGYYDSAQPTKLVDGIPSNIELVYWDYYHTTQASYANRIDSHRLLSRRSPAMAAGSWTWSRFWTALPFTFATNRASMNACKQPHAGVKTVMLTIWGDEGNEVDLLSSLPAWSYYAEHGYEKAQEVDLFRLRTSFDGICGADFDDYVMASRLDDQNPEKQTLDDGIHFAPNTSKWLLWEDASLSFVSPSLHDNGLALEEHYVSLASYLESRLLATCRAKSSHDSDYPLNARLRFPFLLAKTLSLKCGLRYRLHLAYIDQDWEELRLLAGQQPQSRLSKLRHYVELLTDYHRQMWHSMYEPFGWETVDLRYGGLASRLQSLHSRVQHFLDYLDNEAQVTGTSNGTDTRTQSSILGDDDVFLSPQCDSEGDKHEPVTSLPELAIPLETVYSSADQLLDYHRVSRVTYC